MGIFNVRTGSIILLLMLVWLKTVMATDVCNCKGYAGIGGLCYSGLGGPAYAGPGGPAYAGIGWPCYKEIGGKKYDGIGGSCYSGIGGSGKKCPDICK
jgi:hypothetical protein